MKTKLFAITIGLLILALMLWLQSTSWPIAVRVREKFENLLYDEMLALELRQKTSEATKIIIVDVDEKSITQIGRWPWPREHMIDLVKSIHDSGAAVIAFDIVFADVELGPIGELRKLAGKTKIPPAKLQALAELQSYIRGDSDFAEVLRKGDYVLGFVIQASNDLTKGALPPPALTLEKEPSYLVPTFKGYFANLALLQEAAGNGGFLTALPDEDGVIRRAPLILRINNNLFASMPFEAARLYLLHRDFKVNWTQASDNRIVDSIVLGDQIIRTDASGRLLIPFRASSHQFPFISASAVLDRTIDMSVFKDSLVLIGSSASRFGDFHPTPTQPLFPGIEIQATIANSIIENYNIYRPSWGRGLEILLNLSLGLLLAFLLPFMRVVGTVVVAGTVILSVLFAYFYLFTQHGLIVDVTSSLGLVLLNSMFNLGYGLVVEGGRRKNLKSLFEQYVPKEHVELMSEHPEKYNGEGKSAYLTVMFADIIRFTSIVEKLNASEVRELLNQFFTPMTRIIFENHGTVDKYVGDMLMAFWGAPVADAHHAAHALNAALQMRTEVEALKANFKGRGFPEIEIGIGINTGDMYVGDMGSQFRRAYTVLGDSVNVASRVENLIRFYGVYIAVTDHTRRGQDEFAFRLLDKVRVLGRKDAVELYELVGRISDLTTQKQEEIIRHERALELYFSKNWNEATAAFEVLAKEYPDSVLYKLFLRRIMELSQVDLPENWDGAYQWNLK